MKLQHERHASLQVESSNGEDARLIPTQPAERQIDITPQHIMEHALQDEQIKSRILAAIVESSDDAIISKTLGGIITNWNAGAERLFGYTAQEIIGKSILTLIPNDRTNEETEI